MKKLESSFKNMVVSLTFISIAVAGLLAFVNIMTENKIEENDMKKQEKAIRDVTPEFNNNPIEEKFKAGLSAGDSLTVFPAKQDGKLVGIAVETNTKKGFGGEIKIMVGFDTDGKVKNFSVLQHKETPGLGTKMQEWYSNTQKPSQSVINRKWNSNMKVSKDNGEIDAITAATVTSRAFVDAFNRAYEVYTKVVTTTENKTDDKQSQD